MTDSCRSAVRGARALLLLTLAAACGSDGGPTEPEPPTGPSGWSALAAAPVSPGAARHDDIFFLDALRGWLVNTRGEAWRTTDGGTSWTRLQTVASRFNRAVGFASASRGWLGNLNGFNSPTATNALFETTDGGATWTNITARITGTEPVGICGIHVLDAQTILAVGRWNGPAVFVRSLDGGTTWQGIDLAPLASGLVDVYFFDRSTGIAVGGRGVGNSVDEQRSSRTVILLTRDGGTTWETRHVSNTTGKWAWKISFPTRDVGYVSTQGSEQDGVVLRTTDGGLTWTELPAAPGHGFSGIGFVSPSTGWVAADTVVFETRDGGTSWRPVTLGPNVNRFRILGPDRAFAAGATVYLYNGAAAAPAR